MNKSFIGTVACVWCKKIFTKRVIRSRPQQRHYCSNDCRTSDKSSYVSAWSSDRRDSISKKNSGAGNPNFGKRWSWERRQKFSEFKTNQYAGNPTLAAECGKSNRGVKFTAERIAAMHASRSPDSYRRSFDDNVRQKIGKKSKEKWTNEYRQKYRATMEKAGYWIPLSEIPPYRLYFNEANWIERMVDHFSESELEMLQLHGMFSYTNSKGWVRDHIVPRRVGYEMGLPPYILRHPANLQFISHAENIQKGHADRRLTYNQKVSTILLLVRTIKNYSKHWQEHELCLRYIQERFPCAAL